jgi:hypothetical protein
MNFTKETKNLCKSVQSVSSVFHFYTCGYTVALGGVSAAADEVVLLLNTTPPIQKFKISQET